MPNTDTLATKLRWKAAAWLQDHTAWCWTYLVCWAAYGFRDRLTDAKAEGLKCQREVDGCYCGKFRSSDA